MIQSLLITIFFLVGSLLGGQTMYEEAARFLDNNTSGHSVHVAHEYIRKLLGSQNIAYNLLSGGAHDQYESYLIGARNATLCVSLPLRADPSMLAMFERLLQLRTEDKESRIAILLQASFEQNAAVTVIEEAVQRLPKNTALILLDDAIGIDPLIVQSGIPHMGPRYLYDLVHKENTEGIPIVYQGSRLIDAINRELFDGASIASMLLSKNVPTLTFTGHTNTRSDSRADTLADRQHSIDKLAQLISRMAEALDSNETIRRVDWQTQFLTLQYGLLDPIFVTEIQLYLVSLVIFALFLLVLVFVRKGFDRYITLLLRHWKELLVFTALLIVAVGIGHSATRLFLDFRPDMHILAAIILKLSLSLGVLYLLYPIAAQIFQIRWANRFLTVFTLFWVIINMFLLPVISLSFILHNTVILLCCYMFSISRHVRVKMLFLVLAVLPFFAEIVFVRHLQAEAVISEFLSSPLLGNAVVIALVFPFFCMLARCELLLCRGRLYISHGCSIAFFSIAIILCSIAAFRTPEIELNILEQIDLQKQEHSLSISIPKAVKPYTFSYKGRIYHAKGQVHESFSIPFADDGTSITLTENHTLPLFRFRIEYRAWEAPTVFRVSTESDDSFIPQIATAFSEQSIGSETSAFTIIRNFAPPSADASLVVSGQSLPHVRVALEYPGSSSVVHGEAASRIFRGESKKEYIYESTTQ